MVFMFESSYKTNRSGRIDAVLNLVLKFLLSRLVIFLERY